MLSQNFRGGGRAAWHILSIVGAAYFCTCLYVYMYVPPRVWLFVCLFNWWTQTLTSALTATTVMAACIAVEILTVDSSASVLPMDHLRRLPCASVGQLHAMTVLRCVAVFIVTSNTVLCYSYATIFKSLTNLERRWSQFCPLQIIYSTSRTAGPKGGRPENWPENLLNRNNSAIRRPMVLKFGRLRLVCYTFRMIKDENNGHWMQR